MKTMKPCKRCGQTEFNSTCDSCQQRKLYYARTPEQVAADRVKARAYYQSHKAHIKARSIRYHQTHPWVIHNSNQRRLAQELDHYIEPVNDLQVFERDGWICQLCDEPVDRNLHWPDPLSASLDHIIPITKGGTDKYANAQLAHLQCNLIKGISQCSQ
jgi:5-methylcytosine-specific restriction endonuclease McrA